MRPRPRFIAALGIALLLSATFLPHVIAAEGMTVPIGVSPDALGPEPTGQVVARGVLLGRGGKSTSGRVAALLWPSQAVASSMSDGDTFKTPTIGWAPVGGDGSFTLHIDPSRIPSAFVGTQGQLNVLLVGWNGSFEGVQQFSTDAGEQTAGAQAASAARYGTPKAAIRLKLGLKQRTPAISTAMDGGITPNIYPNPDLLGCWWELVSRDRVVENDIEMYTYATTGTGVLGASKSISTGGAINYSGTFGSFEFSGTNTTTQSTTWTPAFSSQDRYLNIEMEFGRYREWCRGLHNVPYVFRWAFEPIKPTGGTSITNLSTVPTWCYNSGVNVAGPAVWERKLTSGTTTKFSVGAKTSGVIGINLPFEASYNSSSSAERILKYNITGSTAHFCGDTAYPDSAGRIREGPTRQ